MENTNDAKLVSYVNFEMNEINNLSADLYESMMDRENSEVVVIVDSMVDRLKNIKQSHK